MKILDRGSMVFSRFFLIGMFVSAFWLVGVGAEVVVVDWTEENMYIGRMSWGNFLEDCTREGTFLSTGSSFQDVDFHLELDFEKETVTGYFSAISEVISGLAPYSHSAEGQISGIIKKVHWGGSTWYWEWEGSASVSLHFLQKHRCLIDGEDYWSSRDEIIQVNAEFSGVGWSEYNTTDVELRWWDEGGGSQAARSFSLAFTTSQGLEYVPVPNPIDLNVDVHVPEEVSVEASEILFSVEASGDDLSLVEEVAWQVVYWDAGEDWWVDEYVQNDLESFRVSREILDDWSWYLEEYGETIDGEKRLLMTVWLMVYKDIEENLVIEPQKYNFTLSSARSTRFTLVVPEEMDVYPTGKNSTSFNLDYSGTEVTSAITFEIEGSPPAYLSIALEKTSAQKASNGIIENKITVELDTSKLAGTSLPTEYTIHIKAKSTTKEGTVEDSNGITLQIKPVKWLILHYIASDTVPPLQIDDEKNVEEIISAFQENKSPQVGYNLLIDLEKNWNNPPQLKDSTILSGRKTHLLKYYNNQLEVIESKDTLDMSKAATLTDFIKKTKEITPNEKIVLILTDHGYGINGILRDRHKGTASPTDLSILELDKALEGHHIELLIFEACEMGEIEVLYELRDRADYILSSQLNLFGFSFDYKEAITPLLKKPSLNTVDIGKLFINSYNLPSSPMDYTITLIDTSKLDNLVQEVTGLSSAIIKGFDNTETMNSLLKVLDVRSNDLKCLADNILKLVTDNDIKTAAEKVKNAVDSAVFSHKHYVAGGRVFFKEGTRGFVLIEDEEANVQTEENVVELGRYTYSGINIKIYNLRLSRDFNEKYEAFEFSKKTKWLDVIKKYSSAKKSKIIVRKNQQGNNLYLRTLDPEGCVNGFDPESEYKNRIVLDYFQAEYYSYINGTEIILLPPEATEFTTHVYGGYMEEAEESYTLTYQLIVDGVVVARQTQENPITEYTEHSIPITIVDDEITIGETSIVQLEIPQEEEAIIDSDEPDSDQSSGGGIPSFPMISIILGITLIQFLIRKRM